MASLGRVANSLTKALTPSSKDPLGKIRFTKPIRRASVAGIRFPMVTSSYAVPSVSFCRRMAMTMAGTKLDGPPGTRTGHLRGIEPDRRPWRGHTLRPGPFHGPQPQWDEGAIAFAEEAPQPTGLGQTRIRTLGGGGFQLLKVSPGAKSSPSLGEGRPGARRRLLRSEALHRGLRRGARSRAFASPACSGEARGLRSRSDSKHIRVHDVGSSLEWRPARGHRRRPGPGPSTNLLEGGRDRCGARGSDGPP